MSIRESSSIGENDGFTPDYTADAIRDLEQMRERGELEPRAYLIKKQALVRLYLKSTTSPRRNRFSDDLEP